MPRPPSNAVQIAIRVPVEWLERADEIARLISKPGFGASRTDGFRAAIARGFEVIEGDAGGDRAGATMVTVDGERYRLERASSSDQWEIWRNRDGARVAVLARPRRGGEYAATG